MKMRMSCLILSLGIMSSAVVADQTVSVNGESYSLSALTASCQGIVNDPAAQIACFSALSQLLEEQAPAAQENAVAVADAFDALRAVAQYADGESGVSITGADCKIQISYFGNYFHISRRNVSTVDLFSAEFDASRLQIDQVVDAQGTAVPMLRGTMDVGATATIRGGAALDSTLDNFPARSARTAIDVYASEIVGLLPAQEVQSFDFALIHPNQSQASGEIRSAFETFVTACRQAPPTWSVGANADS
jgi:hypothetical protein